MAFPTPSYAIPNGGKADVAGVASQLFEQAGWMRRLSLEILAEDPTLNVTKAYQLAGMCMNFRAAAVLRIRWAKLRAWSRVASGRTMENSSPPVRATKSESRTLRLRMTANSFRT